MKSVLVALTVTAAVGRIPACCPGTVDFEDGFEQGLGGWWQGADVPDDPDNPGHSVAWSIEVSRDQAAEGQSSVEYFLDGRQDDGTIWLLRSFCVPAESDYAVNLSFQLWSDSESFNTIAKVAAYAGGRTPTQEADFDSSQAANQVAGWKQYDYTFDTASCTCGSLRVAIGISAVWETEMTYFIDDVHVEIQPKSLSE